MAGDGHTEGRGGGGGRRDEGRAVRTGGRGPFLVFLPLIGVPPGEVI